MDTLLLELIIVLGGASAAVVALAVARGVARNRMRHPESVAISPERAGRRSTVAAAFVLAIGVAASLGVAERLRQGIGTTSRAHFDRLAERIGTATAHRFLDHRLAVRGVQGLFAASRTVERDEFRTYFASQRPTEGWPGACGFGFIERVARDDLPAFVAAVRADGAPEFAVDTTEQHSELYVVRFVEPLAENRAVLGFDFATDPVRRAAADQAMLTGRATLSGKVQLRQGNRRAGFVYLLPIYRNGTDPHTPEARRRDLLGWAYAPLDVEQTLTGVVDAAHGRLDLAIHDGSESLGGAPFYESHRAGDDAAVGQHRMFEDWRTVVVGERPWRLWLGTTSRFDADHDRWSPGLVAAVGLFISLLLALVVRNFGTARMRALALARDMTADLVAARDAAQAASRAKSQFLANMSHEIRTPMNAILGHADLLFEDQEVAGDALRRRESLATVRRNADHLLTIISNVLDLSRIEADGLTVRREAFGPAAVVDDALALVRPQANTKQLTLDGIWSTPPPAAIVSDPTRLRQILGNLLGNAVKFTESGGVRLTVAVEADASGGAMLRFTVTDSGIGMTPEQLGRAFDAFEQADTTMSRRYGGAGLGLCISRGLARLLGGDLTLTSAAGVGTTATLTLPIGSPETIDAAPSLPTAAAAAVIQPASPSMAPLAGIRVLLVEDGMDNQRLVSFHLRKAGAEVSVADNGLLAVRTLCIGGDETRPVTTPAPFDLVLMDMQMPVMDGYTATTTLRDKGCSLPIVALTAHAMVGDREKCLAAGCSGYATKPIKKAALIDAVLSAVGALTQSDRGEP